MHWIKRFGYDLLPVLAGVLIALLINNYQQSRKERAFIQKVLTTIAEENIRNEESIVRLMAKQERTLDTLTYYADDAAFSLLDLILKVDGLSTPDLANHGATYLLRSNQNLVEVELLMKLTEIGAEMENYDLATSNMVSQFYQDMHSHSAVDKQRIVIMLQDIMSYERKIIELSREFNALYAAL